VVVAVRNKIAPLEFQNTAYAANSAEVGSLSYEEVNKTWRVNAG